MCGVFLDEENALQHARSLVTHEEWENKIMHVKDGGVWFEFQLEWVEVTAHDIDDRESTGVACAVFASVSRSLRLAHDLMGNTDTDTDTDNACGTLPRKEQQT